MISIQLNLIVCFNDNLKFLKKFIFFSLKAGYTPEVSVEPTYSYQDTYVAETLTSNCLS